MRSERLVLAAVLLASATASANTDTYLATGGVASVDRFVHLGVAVEGGQRIGDSYVFARGQLGSGMSGGAIGRGSYRQARAGIEARDCIAVSWICGFTGVDLGVGRERLFVPYADDPVRHVTGVSAVPRVGFDGGSSIRIRVALELPIYDASVIGGGASFGVGYTF